MSQSDRIIRSEKLSIADRILLVEETPSQGTIVDQWQCRSRIPHKFHRRDRLLRSGCESSFCKRYTWLEVDPNSAAACDLTGVTINALDAYPALNERDLYAMTGFPAELVQQVRDRPNHINYIVPMLVYFTHAVNIDQVPDDQIVFSFERNGIGPDGPGELPVPRGMSGGGIWHVPLREDPAEEVWNPGRMRLGGITIEYVDARREAKGVPLREWLRVLGADLPELLPSVNAVLQQ